MRRNTLNFLVDLATFLVGASIVATGLLLRYVMPPGSGGRLTLLGWARHDWGGLHFWLAVALGVLVFVHLALHWSWICATASRLIRPGSAPDPSGPAWRRALSGCAVLGALAALVVGFVWFAQANVESGGGRGGRGGFGQRGGNVDACGDCDDDCGGKTTLRGGGPGAGPGAGRGFRGGRGDIARHEAQGASAPKSEVTCGGCDTHRPACEAASAGGASASKSECPSKGLCPSARKTVSIPSPADAGGCPSARKTDEPEAAHGAEARQAPRDEDQITGAMTLEEVADRANLCMNRLCLLLDLPPDISPDERLGRVIRQRGLTMSAVRQAIEESGGCPGRSRNP